MSTGFVQIVVGDIVLYRQDKFRKEEYSSDCVHHGGWTDNDFAFNLELGKRSKCRNNRA